MLKEGLAAAIWTMLSDSLETKLVVVSVFSEATAGVVVAVLAVVPVAGEGEAVLAVVSGVVVDPVVPAACSVVGCPGVVLLALG